MIGVTGPSGHDAISVQNVATQNKPTVFLSQLAYDSGLMYPVGTAGKMIVIYQVVL